jgi:hypothetical protein
VFLTHVMPRVLTHARIQFRDIRNPQERDDLLQEVLIYCLIWTRLLVRRKKDPRKFPSMLAQYGVLAVKNGRRACGMNRKDVLSSHAQADHGFHVIRFPTMTEEVREALTDNTVTPPDEQAAFRIDFPAWLSTLTERNRRLVLGLMVRQHTKVLIRRFGVTPGRISQLRREFYHEWRRFHGERP